MQFRIVSGSEKGVTGYLECTAVQECELMASIVTAQLSVLQCSADKRDVIQVTKSNKIKYYNISTNSLAQILRMYRESFLVDINIVFSERYEGTEAQKADYRNRLGRR